MPAIRKNQIIIIGGGILALGAFIGLIYLGITTKTTIGTAQLEFWTPIDNRQTFQDVLDDFSKSTNGNISVSKLVQKNFDTYEQDLIDALATGKGPDVFLLPSSWIPKHADKISPMPVGTGFMDLPQFQSTFVDVASTDLIQNGKIYGLPLFVDTLALFYNKDLFNNAGIASPPQIWSPNPKHPELLDFLTATKKMTKIDTLGRIIQSGAAMGVWSDRKNGNVNRATDILSLLMLQSGTQMVDLKTMTATFDKPRQTSTGEAIFPGLEALKFYTSFANPASQYYSWNSQLHHSIDAFSEGTVGMMLNYAYNIQSLKDKNPHLNFGIAPAPHPYDQSVTINYANYFAVAVSVQGKHPREAWQFAQFLTDPAHVWKYLNAANRPAAARFYIDQQRHDPELGVFAEQALTAKSWYQTDPPAIESIFDNMIESVVAGTASAEAAIKQAESEVSLLMAQQK